MRKLLTGALVLMLVASIVGCGGSNVASDIPAATVGVDFLHDDAKPTAETQTVAGGNSATVSNDTEAATKSQDAESESKSETKKAESATKAPSGNVNSSVPNGCKYYVAASNTTLDAGATMPAKPAKGDKFITGDYEYVYRYDHTTIFMTEEIPGWNVVVKDKSKTEYEPLLSSINGQAVYGLRNTFNGCVNMVKAPAIPSGVRELSDTYSGCTSLKAAPVLPAGIEELWCTFSGCTSLEKMPIIPEGVTDMYCAFADCTSLKTATDIPASVTSMFETFENCTSLTGTMRIKAKGSNIGRYCFRGVDFEKQKFTLEGDAYTISALKNK